MQGPFQFHEVNAFADKDARAAGNPAMICMVDEFPEVSVMEEAAARLGAPMTSFVRPTADPHVFDIRHFSPDGRENHVCGHATLAAAELIAMLDPFLRRGGRLTFRLNPEFGINDDNAFYVEIRGEDIAMTMPAVTELEPVDDPVFYRQLADALGIEESAIVRPSYYAPRIINYVVEVRNQETLLALDPDFEKLKKLALSEAFPHEGIMATVRSEIPGYDILTRVFMPVIDVDEDVACGSANCSVIPYWTMKRQGAFDETKRDFNVLFPYPPLQDRNSVGGVQRLHIDPQKAEVVLTGKAAYMRTVPLDFRMPVPAFNF